MRQRGTLSSDSVLLPLTMTPFERITGLFLTGPRIPSGRRAARLQVVPPSREALVMPHQRAGLGPTFQKSRRVPSGQGESTGFQQGKRPPSGCSPVATVTGSVHLPSTRRESQMETSGFPSPVPPNHAATMPWGVSALVDAGALGNGAAV